MANWTKEQQEAIDIEGSNVIVSAGAGSGKTAVLSERVLRKVKDGIAINKLLILTFTKAAAKEMKDRIRKKLKKEGYIDQVKLIDSSYITTFDSYSLSVVKKYHTYLGVDKDIKITDSTLIDIRKKELLDKIMDQKYKEESSRFQDLITHFALKDDKDLKKMILSINNTLDLKYDKKEYLEHYEELYYADDKLNLVIEEYLTLVKQKQATIKELVNDIGSYLDEKNFEKFCFELAKITNSTTYDNLKQALISFKMPRKNKDYTEEASIIKDEIKSLIDELKDLCIYEDEAQMKEQLFNSKNDTLEIVDIVLRLSNEFEKVKINEELYNFNDISHLAIKLVKEYNDVRSEISSSFQEILIDEYQDTSDTQELFISLISNNNVYMVGDIKQSIYRFRNANPYIFKNKYDTYSIDQTKGHKIDLIKNFRSRDTVLDDINLIFSAIMDDEVGGANYVKEHKMVFGNKTYIEEGYTKQNYHMDILTYPNTKDFKNIVKEAFIIGNDIKNKVEDNYQIFDKDTKTLRDATYSDFAILLDVKKNFTLYKQIFEYLNIPLLLYSDTDLVLSDDLLVLNNLIKLIIFVHGNDYGTDFKYAYMSVARSFLFNYSDSDIFDCFKDNNFKNTEIVKLALSISNKISYLPLEELFNDILTTFNYEEMILTTTNIIDKEKQLEYLTNLLKDLSAKGYTIYDLSYYLEQVIEEGYSIKYKPYQDSCNSVKIMSIHASKGLEFPICYFANLENRFNQMSLKERITYDNNYGILLPEVSEEVTPTIRMKLYRLKAKREDISERIRLFYVALTRCKEKIIIVAPENEETLLIKDLVPVTTRDKYSSFNSIIKSITSVLHPYTTKVEDVKYSNEYLYRQVAEEIKKEKSKTLEVNRLKFNTSHIEQSHFSKSDISLITKEEKDALTLGTKVHEVLEQINFKNPNLGVLDLNDFLKNKITKFLNSKLIQANLDSKIYKEYEFIIKTGNELKRGIIDLLIENDNEVIIIDYKLNNVLDDAYKNQLNGYKSYVSSIVSKPVRLYLYSIIGEEFLEITES